MIRPYLRDLINDHKPPDKVNGYDDGTECEEWKIQLVMQNSCISTTKFHFYETRTIYSASEPVEIFMSSDTEDVIDTLFNTILQRFQQAQET